MYCDYQENFCSNFTTSEGSSSIKRNINYSEGGPFELPSAKRIKSCANQNIYLSSQPVINGSLLQREQSSSRFAEAPFITPAPTPADVDMVDHPIDSENLPSPYSETEDYMFSGYYQEDKTVDIEAVQYSLYDLTPEEYELSNDTLNREDCANDLLDSYDNTERNAIGLNGIQL